MGRFATLLEGLVLVVAACSGSASPAATAPTPAPVTPAPAATPAPVTPTPAATRVTISSAVTWDGRECTYAGPAAVPFMSTVEFKLTNTSASDFAALFVMPVQEGTTWEQVVDWAKSPDEYEPTFFLDVETHVLTPGEAERSPLTALITRNLPYLVVCAKDSTTAGGGMVAPAVLLNVLKG
jgi:hypothetical protein